MIQDNELKCKTINVVFIGVLRLTLGEHCEEQENVQKAITIGIKFFKKKIISCVLYFFHYRLSLLCHPRPPPHCCPWSFFLVARSLHSHSSSRAVRLLSVYESVSMLLVSSVCSLGGIKFCSVLFQNTNK